MSQAKKQKPLKTVDWSHSEAIPRLYRPALEGQAVKKRGAGDSFFRPGNLGIIALGLVITLVAKWTLLGEEDPLLSDIESKTREGKLVVSSASRAIETPDAQTNFSGLTVASEVKNELARDGVVGTAGSLVASSAENSQAKVALDPAAKVDLPPVATLAAMPASRASLRNSFDSGQSISNSTISNLSISNPASDGLGVSRQRPSVEKPEAVINPRPKVETVTLAGVFSHKVSSGDTWLAIFDRYGFPAIEARQIDKLLRNSREVSHHLRPGQAIEFSRKEDGQLDRVSMDIDPVRTVRILKASSSEASSRFSFDLLEKEVENKEMVAGGRIESTLSEAAERSGLGYAMVDDFVDMFSNKIRFDKDLQNGDRFSVIYNKQFLEDGTEVGNGELVAAGVRVGGDVFRAFKIKDRSGVEHVVDREGKILGNTFLRYPLRFSRISSHFSHSRLHPILNRRKPHRGVDFAAPRGTPVRSVADGKVTFAGRKGPNGIMIKISHGPRYGTAYLHLAKISKGLRVGSRVKRGQVIGTVGSTGRSTGPHLDFRFYDNGKSVNPLKVKLPTIDYNKKLEFDRKQFAERVKKLEQNLNLHSVKKLEDSQTKIVLKEQSEAEQLTAGG